MNAYIQERSSGTVSMNDVLAMLSQLSVDNKRWLAVKLFEETEDVAEDDCCSHETIVSDLKQACKEMRMYDEGIIQFKSAEELLHEIQNI